MSRYVDIKPYENCKIVLHKEDEGVRCRDLPTADVEEVVRCKDCRLATEDIMIAGWYHCHNNGMIHKPDAFCSYGERKDENDK